MPRCVIINDKNGSIMPEDQNSGNNMNRVARSALVLGCAMIF